MNEENDVFDNNISSIIELSLKENIDEIILLYTIQSMMANQKQSKLLESLCSRLQPIVEYFNVEIDRQHKILGGDILDIQIGLWYSICMRYIELLKVYANGSEFAYFMRRISHVKNLYAKDRIHSLFGNQHQNTQRLLLTDNQGDDMHETI
jgi:hypothetical protein